jgi:eukaryotic-like serine/threonine-protein kinase
VTTPLRPGDPRQLGGYQLLSRLGEGGMGTVYLGRGRDGRLVAIKVIRPEYSSEDEFRARFRSEVTRARQVPPFCTAEVIDADPEHHPPYLVVEYVDGPSLADVVHEQGPLAAGSLHSVAVGVATALTAIHGAGVIHRDLKPRNVLFSLGTPKVIDFGIARALEVTSQHTRTDQMVGTVAYMAPERFDTGTARSVSPAADVFAWGAVVAYAGTGRTPFQGDSAAATAARILTQPPELTGLYGSLRDLVALTLAKDPADRPSSHELLDMLLTAGPAAASAMPSDLRQAAEAAQHSGRFSTGDTPTPIRPRARRRTWAWVTAGIATLAVLAAGFLVSRSGPGDGRRTAAALPAASASGSSAPSSAAAVASAVPVSVRGQSVIDSLGRPGQWAATKEDAGTCVFAGHLAVTTGSSGEYQCRGPKDTFAGDQTIKTDVRLDETGSCAEIWFRYVALSGYRLSVCAAALKLELDDDDNGVSALATASTGLFAVGSRHRIEIAVRNAVATASVDNAPLVKAPVTDPTLASGQVVLGAAVAEDSSEAKASFANVEIRPTPPAGPQPLFTDVTEGASQSIAKILAYNRAAHSAVVEPVLYYSGPDYCKAHAIKATDSRCEREWETDDSHEKVTVPLADDARLTTVRDGDPDCMRSISDIVIAGSCKLTPTGYASWLKDHGEALVRLSVQNGTTTAIAELFLP